jgi:hypothetical protein
MRMTKRGLWVTGFACACFVYPAFATQSTSTTQTTPTSTTAKTTHTASSSATKPTTHSTTTTTTHTSHTSTAPAKKTASATKPSATSKSSHTATTAKTTHSTKTKAETKKLQAYTFDFNPPRASDWQLVQNAFDKNGYARTYMLPQTGDATPESVTISYGRNIHTSVKASMQEVVDNFKKINCKQKQSHVIQQKTDALVFSTTLDQCTNGKAVTQIFKVFNMPDGQYSIIYSADPRKTSKSAIADMQKAVESGKLVPIPAS